MNLIQTIKEHPIRPLLTAFLLILALFPQSGGGNKDARIATTAALVYDHTFAITNYFWSQDWARSPVDNKIYANKPPGPSIIAVPLYAVLSKLTLAPITTQAAHYKQLYTDRNIYNHILSIVLQAIPYALVVLLATRWLMQQKLSATAIYYGTLAMVFGTTASLLMNSYFGHGMAAMFLLAATLAMLYKKYDICGLLLGWAALSDYGAALVAPLFLLSIFLRERHSIVTPFYRIAAGICIPALIWILFHGIIFGHPLHLVSQYSNPIFVDSTSEYKIWGLFSSSIHYETLVQLIRGSQRGLAVTQPWVLVTLITAFLFLLRRKNIHPDFAHLTMISGVGLIALLLVNSSFNGWHAGWAPGPRYLSSILPIFGILAALLYTKSPPILRILLWCSLLVPITLFAFSYGTTILIPPGLPLWQFYWNTLRTSTSIQPLLNIVIIIGIIAVAARISYARISRTHHQG